jgi:hypothetical protein
MEAKYPTDAHESGCQRPSYATYFYKLHESRKPVDKSPLFDAARGTNPRFSTLHPLRRRFLSQDEIRQRQTVDDLNINIPLWKTLDVSRAKYQETQTLKYKIKKQMRDLKKPRLVITVAICTTMIYGAWWFFRSPSQNANYWRSLVLNFLSFKPNLTPTEIRNRFNDTTIVPIRPVENHTHPVAAADRSSASAFADHLGRVLGLTPYFIQMSNNDQKKGRVGSRTWYWHKDAAAEVKKMELPQNPLVVMVDVDQYFDMPEFLADHWHPTLIYTFQPGAVARVGTNYSFTFNKDNQVNYRVTGGGLYVHQVWNYSTDVIAVSKTFMGIPYYVASYNVDRRQTSLDHEVIMLTPLRRWRFISAIAAWLALTSQKLQRLKPHVGQGFTRLALHGEVPQMSTGKVDTYLCATIPRETDDGLASAARVFKHDLIVAQTKSLTQTPQDQATILTEYHVSKCPSKPDVVCPVPESIQSYQVGPPLDYDPDAKNLMVPFMTPMIDGAFVPDRTLNNERYAILERVEKPRPKPLRLTKFMTMIMSEFVSRMIPEEYAWQLEPTDFDTVYERQPRPTQRHILDAASFLVAKRMVKSFMKAEPYQNVKPPRMISTINGVDKMEYSRITYAWYEVLSDQSWYAFGRTPKAIASRVAEICSEASMVVNSDFSKFDGHGSNLMRDLESMALVRAFKPCHHQAVLALHRAQYNLPAVSTFGEWYETGYGRASGSPETAMFNSLLNAFIAYLAFRMTDTPTGKIQPDEAFSKLGIYGGDDGLTADIDLKMYHRAAQMLGQELTTEPITREKFGVKFLARMYSPYVWSGDKTSTCDLMRQLTKFHVTVKLPSNVSPKEKFVEKARALLLSDRNTPILGELCRVAEELEFGTGSERFVPDVKTAPMRGWCSMYGQDEQYPNEYNAWMMAYMAMHLPLFNYNRFKEWLTGVKTWEQILSPPMFQETVPPEPKVQCIVRGIEHTPGEEKEKNEEKKEEEINEVKEEVKESTVVERKESKYGNWGKQATVVPEPLPTFPPAMAPENIVIKTSDIKKKKTTPVEVKESKQETKVKEVDRPPRKMDSPPKKTEKKSKQTTRSQKFKEKTAVKNTKDDSVPCPAYVPRSEKQGRSDARAWRVKN